MATLFDIIPNDIHDRIAYFLFSSTKYPENHFCEACMIDSVADDNLLDTLLDYARSGPDQCCAVAIAMSMRLHVTRDWRSKRVVDWICTLAHLLETLDISEAQKLVFPISFPLLPKLERAVINMRPEELSLIRRSPNLRNLRVFVHHDFWDIFVSTVGSLQLHVLEMEFVHEGSMTGLSKEDLMRLCDACPIVQSLYLDPCTICLPPQAWDMIQRMPSLKQLRVNAVIEEQYIPFVQSLKEVQLEKIEDIESVTRFGPAVTHLSYSQSSDEDINRIRMLPNLRSLEITLMKGHEEDLVRMIDNVEELSLSWERSGYFRSVQGSRGARRNVFPVYYEPDGDILEEILKSAKCLKSLRIEKAVVSSDVITRLLKTIGGSLEKFEICHDWQKESVPSRMACILEGIAQNCPKMETLSFLEKRHATCNEPRLPIIATKNETRRCFKALEEVVSAVPGFTSRSYRHVRSTILNRFTEDQPDYITWKRMPYLS